MEDNQCLCDKDLLSMGRHESVCSHYQWKYKLPCDGTDPDFLYNEVCIELEKVKKEKELLELKLSIIKDKLLKMLEGEQ